jgi:hypothetical protein
MRGWPIATVNRGRVVMRDGQICGDEGWGRLVPRTARLAGTA